MRLFYAAIADREALLMARFQHVRSTMPRLRLVVLGGGDAGRADVAGLPAHVAAIVLLDPPPAILDQVQLVIASSPEAGDVTGRLWPACTWSEVAVAYQGWMHDVALPYQRTESLLSTGELRPVGTPQEVVHLEVVGRCNATQFACYIEPIERDLDLRVESTSVVHHQPVPVARDPRLSVPDVQVVAPPFESAHPDTTLNFPSWQDHERRLGEAARHVVAFLDSVKNHLDARLRFVLGFLEPAFDPLGFAVGPDDITGLRGFIRHLNGVIATWCHGQPDTYFVDVPSLSGYVGLARTDDLFRNHSAHRSVGGSDDDEYTGPFELELEYHQGESFEFAVPLYCHVVQQHVFDRRTTILGRDPVKLVICDLDNTLWRGVVAEGQLGETIGRPNALADTIMTLKRRGILLAIASKNDPSVIEPIFDQIMARNSVTVTLDDFVMRRISFEPKSKGIRAILEATNIAAANTVFIDDNPLEREEVIAAFPEIRILGAEMETMRRELLLSPYTQREILTKEDAERTATTRARVALHTAVTSGGDAGDYLNSLRLELTIGSATDLHSDAARRCIQLINKTNQWNLNGLGVSESELAVLLDRGHLLLHGSVRDAHSDHGLVVACVLDPAALVFRSLVVSCRVIGMGIDEAFVAALGQRFGPLTADFRETPRNHAASAFVAQHGEAGPLSATLPAYVTVEDTSAVLL